MASYTATAPLAPMARELRTGDQTPTDLVTAIQDRFSTVEPAIEAFLPESDRWSRVQADARTIEAEFPDPAERPPLYGVPIGVKDVFHVDGMATRAGSSLPADAFQGTEAASVTALRDAGAIVLGKTVTTEFAYAEPGPTTNPHDTDYAPGGSSSGSAAAVAAGLVPLALGTQTVGSVIRPAAFCGVVGIKPTDGRVSTDGVVPLAASVDQVGCFTQDVDGAQLAASVLCEGWQPVGEPETRPRLGAVDGAYLSQASSTGQDHFQTHLARLDAAGYDIERVEVFPQIEAVNERHERLVAGEAALAHAELYPEYSERYAETTAALIERGRDIDVESVAEGRRGRTLLRQSIHDCMDDSDLDVILSPSAPGPAPEGTDTTGDPVMNLPWTHAGVPTVTLPASTTDTGLPIGLQIAGRAAADESLLAWCRALEAALAE